MNFDDFILKFKVGILRLRNHFGKINSSLTIDSYSRINNAILIFFPIDEKYCRIASYSFKTLNELQDKGVEIHICLSDNLKKLIESINCDKFTYLKNGNNIIKLNKSIDNLKKYDMIIDLNPTTNIAISEIIKNITATYKIGFKSNISDTFYNIQLDLSNNKFLETSYGQIKNILKIS
ncbi:MAG: hypothetical protein CMF96_01450 [Candidatus Marinimicrobia bacterium]|nr:hypothetical protein [Candidatus Neomarinimicrobiota bacterium]|tara:strand:- start:5100 stop:5633 length:534 start_codon:yes stop_codon:yes gene_type:complete